MVAVGSQGFGKINTVYKGGKDTNRTVIMNQESQPPRANVREIKEEMLLI